MLTGIDMTCSNLCHIISSSLLVLVVWLWHYLAQSLGDPADHPTLPVCARDVNESSTRCGLYSYLCLMH